MEINQPGEISSSCVNKSETSDRKFRFVDDEEYFYQNRCKIAEFVGKPLCLVGLSRKKIPIDEVPYAVLTCPEEPVSILIILLIGPITFAISIGLIGMCG